MKAYCVKCREKREIKEAEATYNAKGAPVTKGVCEDCGTKVYRLGKTEEHEGVEKPILQPKVPERLGNLVIVESPAKAKTVGRFLGEKYKVRASVGHVRDLLRSQLSVDVENNFTPKYRVPNDKTEVVKELKGLAAKSKKIYLATDPDREGEAIAWHLMESANIDADRAERVVFHEITKTAVADAFAHPRVLDMDLVNAQQARRVLDRLVGYGITPILWAKVRGGLSAGRVQSVALRLIVEREREIDSFVPVEFWTIAAELLPESGKKSYIAKLVKVDKADPLLANQTDAQRLADDMKQAVYILDSIKIGTRKRKPSAPFITSTLQQEASRKLSFTTKRTMIVAQQLYEGVEIGNGGPTGLITYMRTDSTHVAEQAVHEARGYIKERFGTDYLPSRSPIYKTRNASAQEAHEAIRPTSVNNIPEKVEPFLSKDQFRLYKLIWQRFVASQMESALYDTITVEVEGKGKSHQYLLRASGSKLRFPGFLVVYEEAKDENKVDEDADNVDIPIDDMREGQPQKLINLITEQHFTQPPPRFTDASLIQVLEENGIGRPSTYAPIISTIQDRGYVSRESKALYPTEIGFLVNDLIVEYFPTIVDIGFTSGMEENLDEVAEGKKDWVEVIRKFYEPFEKSLDIAQKHMPEKKLEPEKANRPCPKCGHDLVIRIGRFGKFISCSNFPNCRYTEPWINKIGVTCPTCQLGEVIERRTKKGRIFYGCERYPECDFTSWKRPLSISCPKCGGTLVESNKNHAQCLDCKETFLKKELDIEE